MPRQLVLNLRVKAAVLSAGDVKELLEISQDYQSLLVEGNKPLFERLLVDFFLLYWDYTLRQVGFYLVEQFIHALEERSLLFWL